MIELFYIILMQISILIKRLDTLEIKEEEKDPERNVYQEEDKIEERKRGIIKRKGTIVFTNNKNSKNPKKEGVEPMLKVSKWLLSYMDAQEDIVQRFE